MFFDLGMTHVSLHFNPQNVCINFNRINIYNTELKVYKLWLRVKDLDTPYFNHTDDKCNSQT